MQSLVTPSQFYFRVVPGGTPALLSTPTSHFHLSKKQRPATEACPAGFLLFAHRPTLSRRGCRRLAMADAKDNPAVGYYSGRPLEYDPQQAQAVPAPPHDTAGEHANGLPAPPPQPQQDIGEQANHTHVHGVPGYYNGRVNNTNTTAAPPLASAPVAPPPPPAPAVEPERKLSWIDKCLMCFTGGRNARR